MRKGLRAVEVLERVERLWSDAPVVEFARRWQTLLEERSVSEFTAESYRSVVTAV